MGCFALGSRGRPKAAKGPMPDSSWLGALPLGILMFLGMFIARQRRQQARKRAERQLPELASELGLEYRTAPGLGGLGKLSGVLGGCRVWIDPAEAALVRVYFPDPIEISLRTYEHGKRPPPGTERFDAEDEAVNGFFVERYASPALADALFEDARLGACLGSVRAATRARLENMAVSSEGIECQLNYKKPTYIPASMLRQLLPALLDLATLIKAVHEESTAAQRD